MADVPRVILLLYPNAGYDRGILQGIRRYARDHGPWIFYLAGEEPGLPLPEMETVSSTRIKAIDVGKGRRRMYVPNLRQWGATGIIGRLQTPEIAKMALKSGVPVIAMDLSDEQLAGGLSLAKVSELRPDSHKAGRMAAEHLLERGFRHFGYCGYANRTWSERRRQGFCERLEEAGFRCDVYQPPKQKTPLPWQRERKSITAWLDSLPKPVGIMTCNDVRGLQVLETCTLAENSRARRRGRGGRGRRSASVRVVESFAVQRRVESRTRRLSSGRIARQADVRVETRVRSESRSSRFGSSRGNRPTWWPSRIRRSPPPCDSSARTPTSRSASTTSWRRSRSRAEPWKSASSTALGRSIRSEIQRVRLTRTKQLLLETDMSAAKISDVVGFSSLSYLSKVFHRETGETLAQYRRHNRPS